MIYVVGIGPGLEEMMTGEARAALADAEVIIGYHTYLQQIEHLTCGKKVYGSKMMQEIERCEQTFAEAEKGRKVAIISGGDSGIYAMAGLMLEMASRRPESPEIKIISGLSALNVCAARLGAPLTHDFAAISLSDLLTPWEKIEKRLEYAAAADFVLVIYNPKSSKRKWQIERATEIIAGHRQPATPVGIVTAGGRSGEEAVIAELGNFLEHEINMQSTVIIGNSATFVWNGYMITPRGYREKYNI